MGVPAPMLLIPCLIAMGWPTAAWPTTAHPQRAQPLTLSAEGLETLLNVTSEGTQRDLDASTRDTTMSRHCLSSHCDDKPPADAAASASVTMPGAPLPQGGQPHGPSTCPDHTMLHLMDHVVPGKTLSSPSCSVGRRPQVFGKHYRRPSTHPHMSRGVPPKEKGLFSFLGLRQRKVCPFSSASETADCRSAEAGAVPSPAFVWSRSTVPPHMYHRICIAAHAALAGHRGIEITRNIVRRSLFKDLTKFVHAFVKRCVRAYNV